MPLCRYGPSCSKLNCPFDHKEGSQATNEGDRSESPVCIFYNKKDGCNPREGRQCRYTHIDMPPCRNGPSCGTKGCENSHKITNHFLGARANNKPPDPEQRLDLPQIIKDLVQIEIAKLNPTANTHLQNDDQTVQLSQSQMPHGQIRCPTVPQNVTNPIQNCRQNNINLMNSNYQQIPMTYYSPRCKQDQ